MFKLWILIGHEENSGWRQIKFSVYYKKNPKNVLKYSKNYYKNSMQPDEYQRFWKLYLYL